MAAQELRWLTYLLADLGEPPRSPPVLYVDNKAMLALCREHRLEHRTKHIALRYFLARELQQRGQLRLAYVASEANTADIITKALLPGDHQRFCTMLGFLLVPTRFLVHPFLILHTSVPFPPGGGSQAKFGDPRSPSPPGGGSQANFGDPRSLPPLGAALRPTCEPSVPSSLGAAPGPSFRCACS
ncbi:unnamed protein product [Closterium sp. NIES-54]